MLIDSFSPQWLDELRTSHQTLPDGARLILLIDGAFVPGLFRALPAAAESVLLFESLPGCSEEARDVSPFVVEFDPLERSLLRVLDRCNGWPMVSAIVTSETVEQLGKRLAAWCVVEVDGQRFNFRFPDTRRLPGIISALTQPQRWGLAGDALSWHYIGRDGSWRALPLEPSTNVLPGPNQAKLDDVQFGRLVKDSEPDEIWVRLQDYGIQSTLLPSERYALLVNALSVVENDKFNEMQKIRWCGHYMTLPKDHEAVDCQAELKDWVQKNVRSKGEALSRIA